MATPVVVNSGWHCPPRTTPGARGRREEVAPLGCCTEKARGCGKDCYSPLSARVDLLVFCHKTGGIAEVL